MGTLNLFDVQFEVVKKNPGGSAGATYQYRKGVRRATVSAASAHPKDILAVLTADITGVQGTEVIEILSISPGDGIGTEGAVFS